MLFGLNLICLYRLPFSSPSVTPGFLPVQRSMDWRVCPKRFSLKGHYKDRAIILVQIIETKDFFSSPSGFPSAVSGKAESVWVAWQRRSDWQQQGRCEWFWGDRKLGNRFPTEDLLRKSISSSSVLPEALFYNLNTKRTLTCCIFL